MRHHASSIRRIGWIVTGAVFSWLALAKAEAQEAPIVRPPQGGVATPVQRPRQTPSATCETAQLLLCDGATGTRAAVRTLGGSLHFGAVIDSPVRVGPGGGGLDFSSYQDHLVVRAEGNVGVGTGNPAHRLAIVGGPAWTSNYWKGALELENGAALAWRANEAGQRFGIGHSNGGFYFFRTTSELATSDAPAVYDLEVKDNGTVSVNVLEIKGGADLSENFDVGGADAAGRRVAVVDIEPGLLVSIDPQNPGWLAVTVRAHDRRVAGVISGAGAVKPGLLMSQTGSAASGRHPVALTGRVYCWADASNGPIAPGDLLTSSSTPGHAMKVTNYAEAQGAIIGKAMSGLAQDRGLVLVLVTLQ